ncbi:MAG: hypothetical protein MUE99_08680, partial [Chitinophagaceae bacterium]|nr:hypothetical protein [Chitinophagaceae bacterium]
MKHSCGLQKHRFTFHSFPLFYKISYLFQVISMTLWMVMGMSCREKQQNDIKDYGFYCWPSTTPCKNREYGMEFSYKMTLIEMVNGQLQTTEGRVATLICCSDIPALMDTLRRFNDTLMAHREKGSGDLEKSCVLPPNIRVFLNRTYDWNSGKSLSFFGFTDQDHS